MAEQPPAGVDPADRRKGGLENVVVGTTSISHVDGARGRLIYRGHDAVALAESGPFESVWYLLANGSMPDAAEAERFRLRVRELGTMDDGESAAVRAAANASVGRGTASPAAAVRSALSALAARRGFE